MHFIIVWRTVNTVQQVINKEKSLKKLVMNSNKALRNSEGWKINRQIIYFKIHSMPICVFTDCMNAPVSDMIIAKWISLPAYLPGHHKMIKNLTFYCVWYEIMLTKTTHNKMCLDLSLTLWGTKLVYYTKFQLQPHCKHNPSATKASHLILLRKSSLLALEIIK
jgi:hypothetical protein